MRRVVLAFASAATVACAASPREPEARAADTTQATPSAAGIGLMAPLQRALTSEVPDAGLMRVLDIAYVGWVGTRDDYLVLVQVDRGSETDAARPFESFCVVGVDEALAAVRGILACFPSRRRGDYRVRFEAVTPDSVVLLGAGATHGDEAARFAFPLAPVRQ